MNSTPNHSSSSPASTAEVVDIVRQTAADHARLRVHGILSEVPEGDTRHLFLDRMDALVDYPARDMTITVQAGMPLNELGNILAKEHQQLPIDSVCDTASIGSIVAGDIAGSRQYGYGTLRDYVIGIEAVDGQGRVFHAGGRVVKNVAGYDLCRLMVGSRGALGVITQLTLKLKPLPEYSMLRTFRFDDAAAFETALERLNTSAATPVMIDFTYASPELARQRSDESNCNRNDLPYSLHIGVEGTEESCRWQLEQLILECEGGEEIHFDGSEDRSIQQHCKDFGYGWTEPRVRCLPSQVSAIASALADQGFSTVGHAGNGILFVVDEAKTGNARPVSESVAADFGAVVSEWDVDHPAHAADPLTERMRQTFDPNSVFFQPEPATRTLNAATKR